MGGAFLGLAEGALASHWNPASIASGETVVFAAYSHPYGIDELTENILGYEQKLGTWGYSSFAWQGFGLEDYHEDILSIAYNFNALSNLIIGVKVEHLNLSINKFGSTSALSYNSGILYNFSDNLNFGATFLRINRPKIPDILPRILACGIAMKVSPDFILTMDIRKSNASKVDFLIGTETKITSNFFFRAGIHNHPWQIAAGWGFNYGWFNLDYAWLNHQSLDGTHQVGASFKLKIED